MEPLDYGHIYDLADVLSCGGRSTPDEASFLVGSTQQDCQHHPKLNRDR